MESPNVYKRHTKLNSSGLLAGYDLETTQAIIACLEGEIAKRDETIARLEPQLNRAIQANYDLREELAACWVAVENYEVFRARIAELEDDLKCAHSMLCEVSKSGMVLRAELAAIKAQEPVGWYTEDHLDDKSATTYSRELADRWVAKGWPVFPLYAAPAAPSHGEQVRDALAELLECPASVVQATVPHAGIEAAPPYQVVLDVSVSLTRWKKARAALEAIAPAAPAADAGHVFYGIDGDHP